MPSDKNPHQLETNLIHGGEPIPRIAGAVVMPIFQTVMYETAGGGNYHDTHYIRLNNTPGHRALHQQLAILENGEAAVVSASGMAAISSALMSVLSTRDHLLLQQHLYGGTHTFVTEHLPKMGISYDFIDMDNPDSWQHQLKPQTKAIYVESIANPLLQVSDLKAVVAFAKAHGLKSIIDNTFTSPVNFRPLDYGFDLSLHSATKYLNGHSDVVAGAAIGSKTLIHSINEKLCYLGGCLDPHALFLLQRGIKTLALRVRYQNASALKIAQFLEQHPRVAKIYYPGLTSSPYHARASSLFAGYGGVLSFELQGGLAAAAAFLNKQTIGVVAPSLGGIETLITRPAETSHAGMSSDERKQLGISDDLIRLSVGIEATEDLIEDFSQALS